MEAIRISREITMASLLLFLSEILPNSRAPKVPEIWIRMTNTINCVCCMPKRVVPTCFLQIEY